MRKKISLIVTQALKGVVFQNGSQGECSIFNLAVVVQNRKEIVLSWYSCQISEKWILLIYCNLFYYDVYTFFHVDLTT